MFELLKKIILLFILTVGLQAQNGPSQNNLVSVSSPAKSQNYSQVNKNGFLYKKQKNEPPF